MPAPSILPAVKLIPPSRAQLLNAIDRNERELRSIGSRLDLPAALRVELLQIANADMALLIRAGRRK